MRTTIGLTFLATLLYAASASDTVVTEHKVINNNVGNGRSSSSGTPQAKATLNLLDGKCGSGREFSMNSNSLTPGSHTRCNTVSQGFDAVKVGGQFFGYKLFHDKECKELVKLSKEVGTDNCYNVESGKGYAYTFEG